MSDTTNCAPDVCVKCAEPVGNNYVVDNRGRWHAACWNKVNPCPAVAEHTEPAFGLGDHPDTRGMAGGSDAAFERVAQLIVEQEQARSRPSELERLRARVGELERENAEQTERADVNWQSCERIKAKWSRDRQRIAELEARLKRCDELD